MSNLPPDVFVAFCMVEADVCPMEVGFVMSEGKALYLSVTEAGMSQHLGGRLNSAFVLSSYLPGFNFRAFNADTHNSHRSLLPKTLRLYLKHCLFDLVSIRKKESSSSLLPCQ